MRRFVQIMTLMLAILAGSLGGYGLAATRRDPCSCCETTLAGLSALNACRVPGRAPNPTDPCNLEAAPRAASLATPLQAVELQDMDGRVEPSPLPSILHLAFLVQPTNAGTRPGNRPYPSSPFLTGRDPSAMLSVFRI